MEQYQAQDNKDRSSKLCWIDNDEVYAMMDGLVYFANKQCGWDLDVDFIEPLQRTKYDVGDFYDWHCDEMGWTKDKRPEGRIRKISFTVLLNDDFEGGEFDIETRNPVEKKRYDTFDLSKKNNTVIFPSHMWHRVRPVKTGVRKSIVGWVLGPP